VRGGGRSGGVAGTGKKKAEAKGVEEENKLRKMVFLIYRNFQIFGL
jgi:hypothetical protein